MENKKDPEIVFSRTLKAGKRIYYLDVKKARNEDLYVCITESKRMQGAPEQQPSFEKHKLFLYKEDFAHFTECLEDVIGYVREQVGEIEERPEVYVPAQHTDAPSDVCAEEVSVSASSISASASASSSSADNSSATASSPAFADDSSAKASQPEAQSPEKRRFNLFGRRKD